MGRCEGRWGRAYKPGEGGRKGAAREKDGSIEENMVQCKGKAKRSANAR